jgi:hypothetical protein
MEDEFWTGIVKRAATHQHINRRSQFSRHFNRMQTLPEDQ